MRVEYIFSLLIVAMLACSCSEPVPWPNSRRYTNAETEMFYQAPQDAPESIQAAYHPTAMVSLDDETIIYADSGTRHVVELDLTSGTQRALFDFSAFPPFYDDAWGSEIIQATEDWYILAMPGQSLLWFNLTTGETAVIGNTQPENALIPNDGLKLQSVSFELFGGLHRTQNGFLIVLGEKIYYVSWDGKSPESFLHSSLKTLAGTNDAGVPGSTNPLEIKLHLFHYTYFAEKDGWIYFWDFRKLRAIRNDETVVITGDGFVSPDCTLDEFYANEIDKSTPIVVWNDKIYSPYWDRHAVVEIDIQSIDEGTPKGTVKSYNLDGGAHNLAVSSRGLLSLDQEIGSFWIHFSFERSRLLFGPETQSERNSIFTDADSPYDPQAIVAPQAITTIHNGSLALVYSPTVSLLSALDIDTGMSSPIWDISLTHFVSDNANKVWAVNGNTLHFLNIDDEGKISNAYVPNFFQRADEMGVPCDSSLLRLPEIPKLQALNNGLLLYTPESIRILDGTEADVSILHDIGWLLPSSMTSEQSLKALAVKKIEQWKAQNWLELALLREDENQYLTVSNLASVPTEFLGVTISADKVRRVSGGGEKSIAEGVRIEETKLEDIEAIAMASSLQMIYVTRPGEIWSADSEGVWHAVNICQPDESWHIRNLEAAGTAKYPVFFAETDDGIYACSARKMHFAGVDFSDSWQKLDIDRVSTCSISKAVFMRDNQVCVDAVKSGEPVCVVPEGDISSGSIACNEDSLFVSGMADDRAVVWTSPLQDPNLLEIWGGNGDGLPQKIAIQDANIGTDLVGMSTDSIPYLYFLMRDTASIWRISAFDEIEADTPVVRLLTDERFSRAQAFAVGFDSTMAVIIDNILYRVDRNGLEALAEIEGDVLEMISFGHAFVVMTTEGLFTWENGRFQKKVENVVEINGKVINYAVPASVHPRMVQAPGKNAVLVPVFEGSRIVKIGL